MDNASIAGFLERIAMLLELKGENPFKVRSFQKAADAVAALEEDAAAMAQDGRLLKVKGVGRAIAMNIGEFLERGSSPLLEELQAQVPEGLLEMANVRGLGPGRIRTIHEKLHVASLGELEYACLENRLAGIKGFGEKSQAAILKEILRLKQYAALFHLHYGHHALEEIAEALRRVGGVLRAEPAGPVRRGMEVVHGGAVVVSCTDAAAVMDAVREGAAACRASEVAGDRAKAAHDFGLPVEIHAVPPERFGARLLWTTGSKEHRGALAHRARERGFLLGEDGLVREGEASPEPAAEEAQIYEALSLAWIPPELREGEGEVEAAAAGTLPALVGPEDIAGILHVHTLYSDGLNSIREMAEAARRLGYRYLGISDHSRSAAYAGGLSIDRLKAQGEEIAALNRELSGFRILHGVESDILKDGSLDYPDEILEELDFVIASVHSSFRMERDAMTERIVRAVRHDATCILGHPTGRLLLGRDPYDVDLGRVLEACAEEGVMVEINANPHRLDLDWRMLKECVRLGIPVCIDPDAHRIDGFEDMRYGIETARKGWLEARHVANCLDAEALLARWRRS